MYPEVWPVDDCVRQGMTPSILSHPQGNDTLFRSTRKGRVGMGNFYIELYGPFIFIAIILASLYIYSKRQ